MQDTFLNKATIAVQNKVVLCWKKSSSMRNPPKILIIDDSSTTRFYMASVLQKVGYQVMAVSDGAEGFSLVLHEPPDCLIVDVVLPGMGGFEICRRLRSRAALRSMPIIMVSTKNTPIDQAWGLRQGANRYLPKPFSEEDLVKAVNEFVPTYKHPSVSAKPNAETGPRPAIHKMGTEPRPTVQNMNAEHRPPVQNAEHRTPVQNVEHRTPVQNAEHRPPVQNAEHRTPVQSTRQNVGTGPRPSVQQNAAGAGHRLSSIRPVWFKWVPQRREGDDMLWMNDPQSIIVRDMQIRYFYAAIDGQRNLEQLGMIMRMGTDDILKVVRILLTQRHIVLYEPGGQPADYATLFPEHS
jgi:CheY-like chemotaxis protein